MKNVSSNLLNRSAELSNTFEVYFCWRSLFLEIYFLLLHFFVSPVLVAPFISTNVSSCQRTYFLFSNFFDLFKPNSNIFFSISAKFEFSHSCLVCQHIFLMNFFSLTKKKTVQSHLSYIRLRISFVIHLSFILHGDSFAAVISTFQHVFHFESLICSKNLYFLIAIVNGVTGGFHIAVERLLWFLFLQVFYFSIISREVVISQCLRRLPGVKLNFQIVYS